MYQILITKYEPKSKEELERMEDMQKDNRRGFHDDFNRPFDPMQGFNKVKQLETVLTDEEFVAAKKSILEVI